jgi:hypothetical protein
MPGGKMNLIKERRPKMNLGNNKKEKNIFQYDHYLSMDWSQKNMAIARMKKNSIEPKIIDVKSDVKEAKKYFSGLKGSKILTIEETTSTHSEGVRDRRISGFHYLFHFSERFSYFYLNKLPAL